jgi:DNA polymerase-3 subunit alpha
MKKQFVHLHVHSDYSLLDGSNRVEDIAKKAAEYNMPAVALTDHGNMMGVVYFEEACQKAGVKPIIGCEVYVAPQGRADRTALVEGQRRYFHMCLFAKNEIGYKNLLVLTSRAYTEGFYYRPRIDDELLAQYHEGLIASGACLAGEINHLLVKGNYNRAKERALFYQNLFGEGNFYLEIQEHGLKEDVILRREIKKLTLDTGIPVIATNDAHYLNKEDEGDNDIFICIGTQAKKSDAKRMRSSPNCYFRSTEEMYELFTDMPEALENTVKLAEKCNVTIPKPGPMLPEFQTPEGFNDNATYLRYLVNEGLKGRYANLTEQIKNRAQYELETIIGMNFVGYFLIVWDFIDWAKRNSISVGPGRGSGAGSIVAYALRITDIDPLKYNLLFERFLNPERISMPDFDIDFTDARRDEVVAYVTQKYGYDNVAGIVTYSTLQTKAVLKDVARVLDIPYNESLAITKAVPNPKDINVDAKYFNVKVALENSDELKKFAERGGAYAELFEVAARLEGLVRGTGVHACGKVIGKSAIVNYVPLLLDPKAKITVSAFEGGIIENCGLVKMDFLGLITLDIIDRTVQMIREHEVNFDITTINEEDKATFLMFSEGKTKAIFQFESEGMQKILRDTRPSSIEDLIALNSLYRPGPMDYIPDFVKGKKNPSRVIYPDESLAEILKPTYGVFVYQEQVMQAAQIYAGYSLGGADILRRAMGKKKKEEMDRQRAVFIEGAANKGHNEKQANDLFDKLEKFAGYGFNKSHAACYSVLAYQTAYLKTHYGAQFMAATLSKVVNNPSSFALYLDEARSMGLTLLPPNINYSESDFVATKGTIYYGFLGMKGVGEAAVNEIINARRDKGNFVNFIDFLDKIPLQSVNKRVVELLISAGLFEGVEQEHNRGELLANFEAACDWAIAKKASEKSGPGLFDMFADEVQTPPYHFKIGANISIEDKLEREKEILGFYISGHPLDKYKGAWQHLHNLTLSKEELDKDRTLTGKIYTLVGIIKNLEFRVTKKGDRMATAIIEDFLGSINVVAFSRALEQGGEHLTDNGAIMLKGKLDTSRGEPQFIVEEIGAPDPTIKAKSTNQAKKNEMHIYLKELIEHQSLIELRELVGGFRGNSPLFFHFNEDGKERVIKASRDWQVEASEFNRLQITKHSLVKQATTL